MSKDVNVKVPLGEVGAKDIRKKNVKLKVPLGTVRIRLPEKK